MNERKIEKLEEMLSGLITMVGGMDKNLKEVQQDQRLMSNKLQTVVEDQVKLRETQTAMSEKMTEIINKLTDMQADQDHIWEKSARNERELAKLKIHLQF